MSRLYAILRLALVALTLFSPQLSYAISEVDRHAVLYDTVFYDEDDAGCDTNSTSSGPLIGNENAEKIYNFFIGKNLAPIHVAGIMGNLAAEGGPNFDPLSQQDGSDDITPKRGVGFGIAQWTFYTRQDALVDFAKSRNQPVGSLGVQLDFLWLELNTNRAGALTSLKKTTTVVDAVHVFMVEFEAPDPDQAHEDRRIAAANSVLAKYGGIAATTQALTTATGCNGLTGTKTAFVDGFTVYNQGDPAWKNLPYGNSTIGRSGCGPAAMAMIITNLTGNNITPDLTAAYGAANGTSSPSGASYHDIAATIAPHYGLKATLIGPNAKAINDTLVGGGLVILAGAGALPFTPGGHFIVIRGVTADGKWKVGDSGHTATNSQEFDPASILANARPASVYAVTK